MELLYYIIVFQIGLIFSIKKSLIRNQFLFFLLWFSIYIFLSVVVRQNFNGDISNYALAMQNPNYRIHPSEFYYLKEPVVWFSQRFLYSIFKNESFVFVITDAIIGSILFKSLKILKSAQYIYFAILLFFPFIIGMQNIYRQWVSMILLLYTFANIWEEGKSKKTYFSFFIACISHNSAAVFLPILFIKSKKFIGNLNLIITIFVSLAILYLGAPSKAPMASGGEFSWLYILTIISTSIFILFLDRGIISIKRRKNHKLIIALAFLSILSLAILGSTGSERISISCLLIVFPMISLIIEERINQKIIPRIILMTIGFLPMLIFASQKIVILN